MTHTIKIYYFPKGMRYTSAALLLAALYLMYLGYVVWGVLMWVMIFFILTAQYVTIIDSGSRNFVDAFSFFGIVITTEKRSFTTLDKIIITKGNYSKRITTRSTDRQLDWTDYTGTLIYDDVGELDLVTRQSKAELVEALKVYATALSVGIEDHSTVSRRTR